MTHNHTCPTCRTPFTCDSDDCSDDDPCYECLRIAHGLEKIDREKAEAELAQEKRYADARVEEQMRCREALSIALAKAEAELADFQRLTYCAYCGDMFAVDGDAALISEHIKTCINHPMRQAEAELADQRKHTDFWNQECILISQKLLDEQLVKIRLEDELERSHKDWEIACSKMRGMTDDRNSWRERAQKAESEIEALAAERAVDFRFNAKIRDELADVKLWSGTQLGEVENPLGLVVEEKVL